MKSPGDISYVTDRKALSKLIGQQESTYSNVLLYGKTYIAPFYEYFLVIDGPEAPNPSLDENTIILDTLLHNHTVRLIARSLDSNTAAFKTDINKIFQSTQLGPRYRKDVSTVMDVVSRYRGSNRFIEVYEEIKSYPAYDENEDWLKLQLQLTYASFLENQPEYDELFKKFEPERIQDSTSQIIKQNLISDTKVFEEIKAKAMQTNLVMVNENHFVPRHRKFVYRLLPYLRAIGYDYFALEALGSKQDSLLNLDEGFPTLETGFYTKEQNYGNLLRYAKALGFEFVAYESSGTVERELGQAQNLYSKTFALNKDAKVLLLGGFAHILEQPTEEGKKWLGAVLHKKYDIDPLTISQTDLNRYRRISKEELSLVEGEYFKGRLQSVDYHLLNNIEQPLNKQEANFSYKNHNSFPVQLTLFLADEMAHEYDYVDKVPFRAVYLNPKEKIDLKLPLKDFYLILFNAKGKEIESKRLSTSNITKEH
ncbi:hypothetical protein [Pontibacter mangrovi]|uniref:Uncharacterized protein n=1 Tax=Pontibacter mangrovi TaxID=2589816 RepID=A0A501W6L1_9BACT|nr:hypothetical protein [Pontibacter mangrovi]TPE44275.1 hypothetical protein FJM65_08960 [Pontibacter mangrovi]